MLERPARWETAEATLRIVRWETDLEAWLAELRSAVLAKLSDGPAQLSSLVL
ncbi:MAG: hypothetical protein IPJ27_12735 [Candidatus Accumulibacter sp.]|uniref:Uncharacterized protein n=1 Tax=Candidatus Accumulibacter proximus TaxID=2954385 RepID=A0A935Q0Z4_9PROT|nr:hypothetical protein [Candidatus Accumulibacter proximus]